MVLVQLLGFVVLVVNVVASVVVSASPQAAEWIVKSEVDHPELVPVVRNIEWLDAVNALAKLLENLAAKRGERPDAPRVPHILRNGIEVVFSPAFGECGIFQRVEVKELPAVRRLVVQLRPFGRLDFNRREVGPSRRVVIAASAL